MNVIKSTLNHCPFSFKLAREGDVFLLTDHWLVPDGRFDQDNGGEMFLPAGWASNRAYLVGIGLPFKKAELVKVIVGGVFPALATVITMNAVPCSTDGTVLATSPGLFPS